MHQAHNSRGTGKDWVTDSTTRFSQFDSEGHPHHQETIYSPGEHQTTDELNSDYVGFDSMQITVNEGTRTQDGGKAEKHGTTYVTYDSNGNFQSVTGDLVHAGDFRWFRVNPENRIIFKQSDKRWEYFIYGPDGGVLAWVGDLPSDPTSADLPTEVNFDPWYHAVSANWPPSCPSQYTVREGDTFASIALQMYGDASCAYVIATANGYSESDAPPAEMVLTIPSPTVVDEHNQSGQLAVYNPGQILGVLYPYMPLPPQHPHRNVFGILVEAFVGALIVAFLAPELLGVLAPMINAGFAGAVLGGGLAFGVADAAADVAEQIVGLAFGMQDKFSFGEVGKQAELGFITGALAGSLHTTRLDLLSGMTSRGSAVATSGVTTTSGTTLDFPHLLLANEVMALGGDAILVATGQKKGDMIWKDLVNGALSVAVNAGLNELPGGEARSSFLKTVVNSEASGFLEAVVTQDKFNAGTAAAQAFGVYLGNAAAEKIQEKHSATKAFEKKLNEGWNERVEERYGYSGFNSEDDARAAFFSGTGPEGGNPNPMGPRSSSSSSHFPSPSGRGVRGEGPMGASSHPSSQRPKGPALFGRSALEGEPAAQLPAPQAEKQRLNGNICRIDWANTELQSSQDAHASQVMTSSSHDSSFEDKISHILWAHQDSWWDKAILAGMHGFDRVMQSSAAVSLDHSIRAGADLVSAFDPFALAIKGEIEWRMGVNPITGVPTSHLQAGLDVGMSFIPGVEAGVVKGIQVAREAGFFRLAGAEGLGPETLAENALNKSRISQESYSAQSPNAAEALSRKYRALQKAQRTAVRIEDTSNGTVKYYTAEEPAHTTGSTRGASYVTEYNPKTGEVTSKIESYDYSGNVTRIHPKMLNGQPLVSQHYPPTAMELLEELANPATSQNYSSIPRF